MKYQTSRAFYGFGLLAPLLIGCVIFMTRPLRPANAAAEAVTTRDPRNWPFAWDSIWNLPAGDKAKLVPGGIRPATGWGMTVDEDVLVLEPTAPATDVVVNTAGWDGSKTRCGTAQPGNVIARGVPIPTNFSTDPGYLGSTPNMSAALLAADGVTVLQTQPFHRCGAGGVATSQYVFESDNLRTGSGIPGAHGGSGMSSLGGTVRLGELVPGGAIRHTVKVNLDCANLCAYSSGEADGKPGFRWPARAADGYAANRYRGSNPALQMGSLLALGGDFDETRLKTEPARILARALRDYGAYVVDDTGWSVYALATEWSPNGRVIDQFRQSWGFDLQSDVTPGCTSADASCQWSNDMATLFTSLSVVDDNAPTSIGGAGTRRQSCAPPFTDGQGGAPSSCGRSGSPNTTVVNANSTTTAPPATTTAPPATTTPAPPPPTTAPPVTTTPAPPPTTTAPPATTATTAPPATTTTKPPATTTPATTTPATSPPSPTTTTAAPVPPTTTNPPAATTTTTKPTTPATTPSTSTTAPAVGTTTTAPPVWPQSLNWMGIRSRQRLILLLEMLRLFWLAIESADPPPLT